MRGKVLKKDGREREIRITPAYAGKRHCKAVFQTVSQDHPRLCGEKLVFFATHRGTKGSPPPMRGKAFAML